MSYPKYEHHIYNAELPILFHFDTLKKSGGYSCSFTHWHGAVEILYIKRGRAEISSNARQIIASPEDIVVINSNSIHTIRPHDDFTKYYCLIIDKKFIEQSGFPVSEKNLKIKVSDSEIALLFKKISKTMHGRIKYSKQAAKGYIYILLSQLYSLYSEDAPPRIQNAAKDKVETIKSAMTYIYDNFQYPITVDDIASHCHISKFYFCRTFKEVSGITAVKFINSFRCERAKELLNTVGYTISEISELCGFESPSYFTKTFKSYYGITPTSFKKQ